VGIGPPNAELVLRLHHGLGESIERGRLGGVPGVGCAQGLGDPRQPRLELRTAPAGRPNSWAERCRPKPAYGPAEMVVVSVPV
jgi:hypothetical protein